MRARENPFRTAAVLRYRYVFPPGESMPTLADRFRRLGGRGAIVGPKGRGKTTLLEDMCRYLRSCGQAVSLLRLSADCRDTAKERSLTLAGSTPQTSILALDGAEQLSWLQWRVFERATRAHAGLIITTHRPGRLPALIRCETDVSILRQMVCSLWEPQDQVSPAGCVPDLDELFQRHDGNLRLCLRELYDGCSERVVGKCDSVR